MDSGITQNAIAVSNQLLYVAQFHADVKRALFLSAEDHGGTRVCLGPFPTNEHDEPGFKSTDTLLWLLKAVGLSFGEDVGRPLLLLGNACGFGGQYAKGPL